MSFLFAGFFLRIYKKNTSWGDGGGIGLGTVDYLEILTKKFVRKQKRRLQQEIEAPTVDMYRYV